MIAKGVLPVADRGGGRAATNSEERRRKRTRARRKHTGCIGTSLRIQQAAEAGSRSRRKAMRPKASLARDALRCQPRTSAGIGSNSSCSAVYPFPSGHRTASACFATISQNSPLAKARSGIKGAQKYSRVFPSGHRAAAACFATASIGQSTVRIKTARKKSRVSNKSQLTKTTKNPKSHKYAKKSQLSVLPKTRVARCVSCEGLHLMERVSCEAAPRAANVSHQGRKVPVARVVGRDHVLGWGGSPCAIVCQCLYFQLAATCRMTDTHASTRHFSFPTVPRQQGLYV